MIGALKIFSACLFIYYRALAHAGLGCYKPICRTIGEPTVNYDDKCRCKNV